MRLMNLNYSIAKKSEFFLLVNSDESLFGRYLRPFSQDFFQGLNGCLELIHYKWTQSSFDDVMITIFFGTSPLHGLPDVLNSTGDDIGQAFASWIFIGNSSYENDNSRDVLNMKFPDRRSRPWNSCIHVGWINWSRPLRRNFSIHSVIHPCSRFLMILNHKSCILQARSMRLAIILTNSFMHNRNDAHSTRCGPYFGTAVEAVQLYHASNQMKRWNLQKRDKHILFWGVKTDSSFGMWKHTLLLGCVGERISLRCRQVTRKAPETVKIFLSYSFAVEMGHFDMVRWKYDSVRISSMLRDTLELILWKKADKKCKDQKSSFFREGCFDRKEDISNTANKRCSRQVLQLRCSSSYSIKFYT